MTSAVESEVSIPLILISPTPTHKGTEGRAPVWGSEFTIKVTERIIVGFGDCAVVVVLVRSQLS
jgi:hypothetical protein